MEIKKLRSGKGTESSIFNQYKFNLTQSPPNPTPKILNPRVLVLFNHQYLLH